jgi:hypothetical protein
MWSYSDTKWGSSKPKQYLLQHSQLKTYITALALNGLNKESKHNFESPVRNYNFMTYLAQPKTFLFSLTHTDGVLSKLGRKVKSRSGQNYGLMVNE